MLFKTIQYILYYCFSFQDDSMAVKRVGGTTMGGLTGQITMITQTTVIGEARGKRPLQTP